MFSSCKYTLTDNGDKAAVVQEFVLPPNEHICGFLSSLPPQPVPVWIFLLSFFLCLSDFFFFVTIF